MYIYILRDFFEDLTRVSIFILPLIIFWFIVFLVIKICKVNKKSFEYKFHKWTGIMVIFAFLFPWVAFYITQFSFGVQRNFESYDYFVSTKPASFYEFSEQIPDSVKNVEYYCYQTPIQIGNVVCVSLEFNNADAIEQFFSERVGILNNRYCDMTGSRYVVDNNGINSMDANEEELKKCLGEISEMPLSDCKILLYYEQSNANDYRWIVLSEESNTLIEIVSNY